MPGKIDIGGYFERLTHKGRGRRLAEYYRSLRSRLVNEAASMAEAVPQGQVLLVTFPLASAMLVHETDGRLRAQLIPVAKADLEGEAARLAGRPVYTIDAPLPGRRATARDFQALGRTLVLYRNDPAAPGSPAPKSSTPAPGSGTSAIPASPEIPEGPEVPDGPAPPPADGDLP